MSNLNYMSEYRRWCEHPAVDAETKAELAAIASNEEEIKQRFISYLSFGTAGLRGTMNAGTNAMNIYTVAHATQGLATLICKEGEAAMRRGVVIAHDSRNHARDFAVCAAEVLAANGIHAYLFEDLRPTPVLSFSVTHLGCIAGINITASHNPKEYNGYKAYWEDGAQISVEQAEIVSASIAATDIFEGVKRMPLAKGMEDGLIELVGEALDEAYLMRVQEQLIDGSVIKEVADELSVVYTPLHGTGHKLVPEILSRVGVKHLYTVDEQMKIDGNLPTVDFPNPEYKEVFSLGIGIAERTGSDLIIATDPDADRVGIVAKGKDGAFHTVTGNQMGVLLTDYIIGGLRRKGALGENAFAVKSLVSTKMMDRVCEANGVTLYSTFTGFKFIGEVITREKAKGNTDFILGFEESYGYLRGDYARDKDAVVATMLICEMAAYYHKKNMTLIDALDMLYETYGAYVDGVDNIYMKGLSGLENMKALMHRLRTEPPKEIGGARVVRIADDMAGAVYHTDTGATEPTGRGQANVLSFVTEAGDTIVIRPSGTEPKIKLYFLVSGKTMDEAKTKNAAYQKAAAAWVE